MFFKGLLIMCLFSKLNAAEQAKTPVALYNNLLTPEMLSDLANNPHQQVPLNDQQLILVVIRSAPPGTLATKPLDNPIQVQPQKTVVSVDQPKQSYCAGCCKKTGKVCNYCLQCCSTGVDCLNLIASCCQIFTQCCRK